MSDRIYTAITFAPVQCFIEKSRKLRDLYGSSYLISLLSQSICIAANAHDGCIVVSPAHPNITQGMPNQIIIKGEFPKEQAEESFYNTWQCITETCRLWIEEEVQGNGQYCWKREWGLWAKYAWEFFWVVGKPGEKITDVRQRLNEEKRSRNWTGVNWVGESSTLSGTDAVAWPELGKIGDPRHYDYPWKKDPDERKSPVERFYERLSLRLGETFVTAYPGLPQARSQEYGEAFLDPDEELNIPELIKRLITHVAVVEKLKEKMEKLPHLQALLEQIETDLNPQTFRDLNRLQHKEQRTEEQKQYWTGWFQGDGDGASEYFKWLGKQGADCEENGTIAFSTQMRRWGEEFKNNARNYLPNEQSRIIYAGGDDFLGVLYRTDDKLPSKICLHWFSTFKFRIWEGIDPDHPFWQIYLFKLVVRSRSYSLMRYVSCKMGYSRKKITPSVGFVWVSPKVPQRDVLQHCREAEQSAKRQGKDRIAFRIVFSGGNFLEWVCPWRVMEEGLFEKYCDRNQEQGINANWTHFYNDIAVLESRHAFGAENEGPTDVAIALFKVYFGEDNETLNKKNWWNRKVKYKIVHAGILGDRNNYYKNNVLDDRKVNQSLNNWVINLAKVGFHLCSDT